METTDLRVVHSFSCLLILQHSEPYPFSFVSPRVPSPEPTPCLDLFVVFVLHLCPDGYVFSTFFMVFSRVGGVRVASDATEAGSQELLATATSGGRLLSTAKKRAFHRAQRRAQVAGGTFYKGRRCTARSLHVRGVDASADARAPRPGTFRTWQAKPEGP